MRLSQHAFNAAETLIAEHGQEAIAVAGASARDRRARGDEVGCASWLHVRLAAEQLLLVGPFSPVRH